jgi:hypothetical protein
MNIKIPIPDNFYEQYKLLPYNRNVQAVLTKYHLKKVSIEQYLSDFKLDRVSNLPYWLLIISIRQGEYAANHVNHEEPYEDVFDAIRNFEADNVNLLIEMRKLDDNNSERYGNNEENHMMVNINRLLSYTKYVIRSAKYGNIRFNAIYLTDQMIKPIVEICKNNKNYIRHINIMYRKSIEDPANYVDPHNFFIKCLCMIYSKSLMIRCLTNMIYNVEQDDYADLENLSNISLSIVNNKIYENNMLYFMETINIKVFRDQDRSYIRNIPSLITSPVCSDNLNDCGVCFNVYKYKEKENNYIYVGKILIMFIIIYLYHIYI